MLIEKKKKLSVDERKLLGCRRDFSRREIFMEIQGPRSKFELTGAKNWWLVENEDKVSKSSEKVHSKTKMAEN